MKTISVFLCLCLLVASAEAQLFFPQATLNHQSWDAVADMLRHNFEVLQQEELSLHPAFYKKSPAGHHYQFDVLYKNIPLLHAGYKVNTDLQGRVISVKQEACAYDKLKNADIENEIRQWRMTDSAALIRKLSGYGDFTLKISTENEQAVVVAVINNYDKTFDFTSVYNLQGELIKQWNNTRYFKIDTIIHAKVFKPDPLTSLLQTYGGTYIDDTDKNLAWFAPAYIQQDIAATFETGSNTFYPENDLVIIDDFDAPNILPVSGPTADFYYNRSDSGFEDVNVLYHITAFHDHIASLGYDTLMDVGVTVDTHGMLGADNSAFNRNGGSPTLDFGTGGVDDAEDADVIVHEYSHGLSWSANGNDNFNNARSGLDEGLADYFAMSYSRAINPFGWEKIFSWDGHNEFWGGRTATTPNNYPAGANIYAVGEIWNAAMSAIYTNLGQIITDKLMLESMHFFTNTTALSEAAVYVLQSDTLLFAAAHAGTICNRFQSKNILTPNCTPSATEDVSKNEMGIRISNSYGFSFLNEDLEILFDQSASGQLVLYDITGQKVRDLHFTNSKKIPLSPEDLAAGIYILNIRTEHAQLSVKLSK
ncbi:MAG: T9SS type A sorting domain-containing protein [Chitinophagaceae bacterium]|nr:T9SS type A sorting domain-containing protein [Chitinophagaceae bacterium]